MNIIRLFAKGGFYDAEYRFLRPSIGWLGSREAKKLDKESEELKENCQEAERSSLADE